jgi:uncharacterized membrane protein YkoI
MFRRQGMWLMSGLVFAGLAALAGTTRAGQSGATKTALPTAVAGAIQKEFPAAAIDKVEVEEELGLKMYEVEIKAGKVEKTLTVSEDGVIAEVGTEVAAADLPAAAAEAVKKAAPGATIKEVDKDQTLAEPKLAKLPVPKVTYELKVAKEGKVAEVVLAPDGTVLEAPKWQHAKNGHKESAEGKDDAKVALSDKAAAALKKAFPKATVQSVKAEQDEDVTLYEAVLKDSAGEKEVEVAADGMIVDVEVVVAAKDLPKVVSDAAAKAAPGAQVQKVEKVETHAAGRLVMLHSPQVSLKWSWPQGDKQAQSKSPPMAASWSPSSGTKPTRPPRTKIDATPDRTISCGTHTAGLG